MNKVRFLTSTEAVNLIKTNDTIGTVGFIMTGVAEELLLRLGERFEKENNPKNLTVMWASGVGDGKERGINHLCKEGLLKRTIAGHYGMLPKIAPLIVDNKVEAYNFPQGVLTALFGEMAANRPGLVTKVALNTFVDPDYNGGKLNSCTNEDLVKKINIDNEDFLFFKSQKLDVALLRGTESDEDGNIGISKEALKLENLAVASAVKANGGIVIVQVEKIVKNGEIQPKDVYIPSLFVDVVVVVDDEKNHMQTGATQYNQQFITAAKKVNTQERELIMKPLDMKYIIGRRCAMEVSRDDYVINYGIGMPEKVAEILAIEGYKNDFSASVEPGVIGGNALGGLDFGSAINPSAFVTHAQQFDFYDGGGIDTTFLGMAQVDAKGNLNVSKFGAKIPGCGGFINISQNSKKIIFCGTFTAGGLDVEINNGKIKIIQEGKVKKFINDLDHVTYNGIYESSKGKSALIITERAVFKATSEGLTLIEVAPGIDLEKDILAQMEFKPIVSSNLKLMDSSIFIEGKMNLKI